MPLTNDPPWPTPKAGNPSAPNYLETAKGVIVIDGSTGIPVDFRTAIVVDVPPKTFENTNFILSASPVTLNCFGALGNRNATQFTIQNDGNGDFTVNVSIDGVIFGDEKTVKNGEVYAIDGLSIDTIRITYVADSSYRVVIL